MSAGVCDIGTSLRLCPDTLPLTARQPTGTKASARQTNIRYIPFLETDHDDARIHLIIAGRPVGHGLGRQLRRQ
jgi:hypothetical protein